MDKASLILGNLLRAGALCLSVLLLPVASVKAATVGTLLLSGDSTVFGAGVTDPANLLQNMLTNLPFCSQLTVSNIAHSGYTIEDLAGEFDTKVAPHTNDSGIKVLFLEAGLNNQTALNDAFFANLTNYWWRGHTNGFQVCASTILESCYAENLTAMQTMNARIRACVLTNRSIDYFVDSAAIIPAVGSSNSCYFYQSCGLHPNDLGTDIWATNIDSTLGGVSTIHYIDAAATNGLNNGTSWANAWTNVIYTSTYSNNVAPGDTVFIHGGTYPSATQWRPHEGSAGNWVHYIFTNGVANMWCKVILGGYTSFYAAADPTLTNRLVSTYDVANVGTNCNLHLDRSTNWFYADDQGNPTGSGGNCFVIQSDPVSIQWVRFTGFTNIGASGQEGASASANQIYFQNDPPYHTNEIAYCWCDYSGGHGAGAIFAGTSGDSWGNYNIHHCLLENNESDICDMSGSYDFHHNIVRNRRGVGAGGCNDTFVIVGDTERIRIHHNIMEAGDNSLCTGWGSIPVVTNIFFYNNLIQPVTTNYLKPETAGTYPKMQGHMNLSQDMADTNMYHVKGVWFINNTFVFTIWGGPNAFMSLINCTDATRGPKSLTIDPDGWTIKNNLLVQIDTMDLTSSLNVFGFDPADNSYGTGWIFSSNSIVLDYNLFYAVKSNNMTIGKWRPLGWGTTTIMSNLTDVVNTIGYTHNVSTPFAFVDAGNADFRPGTASVKMGEDLTSLLTLMPDLDKDIYGNQRPVGSAWSAGAVEYQTSGLVFWAQFNSSDWVTNGNWLQVTDYSGLTNIATGMDDTGWVTNSWPWHTNGPNGLGAAQFVVNYAPDFGYGTYFAITNLYGLTALTNATWSFWLWDQLPDVSAYDVVMDTGYTSNNWTIASYYGAGAISLARITNNAGAVNRQELAKWPSLITHTGWHHYAATWNGTDTIAYYDGVAFQTNGADGAQTYSGVLISTNANPAASWIGVGVATHNGTPSPGDGDNLPNNGQMWGQMADIRIYNLPLSAAEIGAIYQLGATPPSNQSTIHANRLNVGTVHFGP